MRIARLGQLNQEKPAVMISDTEAVFVDDLVADFNRVELENGAIAKLAKADLTNLAKPVRVIAPKGVRLDTPASVCRCPKALRLNLVSLGWQCTLPNQPRLVAPSLATIRRAHRATPLSHADAAIENWQSLSETKHSPTKAMQPPAANSLSHAGCCATL